MRFIKIGVARETAMNSRCTMIVTIRTAKVDPCSHSAAVVRTYIVIE
jgi:hypothetical protein